MTKEQAAAYVFAQAVAALAAIEGCKAANMERERAGLALAYPEEAFSGIADEYGISHNAVMTVFSDAE
jgi:hypothetical protein